MYDTSDMWSSNARADRQLDSRCSYPSCCTVRHSFLPRDAVRKRGLCCRPVSVRLSVRHIRVLYAQAEDIVKLQNSLSSQQPTKASVGWVGSNNFGLGLKKLTHAQF